MPPFLLSFVPFKEEDMRLKKKKAFIMQTVFCTVGAIFFAVIIYCIYKSAADNNTLVRNVANIYMTLFMVLCAFFLAIAARVHILEKLLIMGMIVHVGAIEYSVINVIITQIAPAAESDVYLPYQINSVLIFAALTVLFMPLVYCFFSRVMKAALPNMDNRIIKRNCAYVFFVLVLFCLADYAEIEDIKLSNYPAFDNILSYYTALAKNKKITVKSEFIAIDGKLRFDAVDLTVLLGNIMENAIENCTGKNLSTYG